MLLRFEAVDVDWQLGGCDNVRQKYKFPPSQLRAITQIQVFGQGVMLPTTRFANAALAPQSGRAVKIEEPTRAAPGRLLQDQMTIEQDSLGACQP